MSTLKKRIGLVGAGGFGFRHLSEILAEPANHGLELAAVADPSDLPEATEALLRSSSANRHRSLEEMFDKEALDGVVIASPIPLHFEMAVQAVSKGLPTYLEKPPVTSLAQLEELMECGGRPLIQVGFHMMSWRVVRDALRRLRSDEIGRIHALRVVALWPRNSAYYQRTSWAGRFSERGRPVLDGPATNAISHYVHFICAAARAAGAGELSDVRGEFYRARPIESYDTCSIVGCFSSGMDFSVVLSHACHGDSVAKLSVESDAGCFEFGSREISELSLPESRRPLQGAYRDFGAFLRNPANGPRVSLDDCRSYVRMTAELLRSKEEIVSIPSDDISIVRSERGEFHAIDGLLPDALLCASRLQTFSEAGVRWAKSSGRIARVFG